MVPHPASYNSLMEKGQSSQIGVPSESEVRQAVY